jgi:general secretion pathway protein I
MIHRRSILRSKSSANRPAAFTLLEIILSLAILAGALVAIGEVVRLADQNAMYARDETEAQILASGVMDELLSGARQVTAVDKLPFDFATEANWVYSVQIEPTTYPEVVRVGVRVEQQIEARLEPINFELYRWILNPDYVTQLANEAAQEAAAAQAAAAAGVGE